MDDIGLMSWRHHNVWIQCSKDESHQVWYPNKIWSTVSAHCWDHAGMKTVSCAITVMRNPLSWCLFFYSGNVRRSSINDNCQTARPCALDDRLQIWKHPHRCFIHGKIDMIEIQVVPCSILGLFPCIAFVLLLFLDSLYLAWLVLVPLPPVLAWAIRLPLYFLFLAYIFTFTGFSRVNNISARAL